MKLKIAIIISMLWISHHSFAQNNSGIASSDMNEELLDQYDDDLKSKASKRKASTSKINYQQRRWKTIKREIQNNKNELADKKPKTSTMMDTIFLKLPSKNRDRVITNH